MLEQFFIILIDNEMEFLLLELGFFSVKGDDEYLLVFWVLFQYFSQVLFDCVEGWVVVEFIIGIQGEVKVFRVVDFIFKGVFE